MPGSCCRHKLQRKQVPASEIDPASVRSTALSQDQQKPIARQELTHDYPSQPAPFLTARTVTYCTEIKGTPRTRGNDSLLGVGSRGTLGFALASDSSRATSKGSCVIGPLRQVGRWRSPLTLGREAGVPRVGFRLFSYSSAITRRCKALADLSIDEERPIACDEFQRNFITAVQDEAILAGVRLRPYDVVWTRPRTALTKDMGRRSRSARV
jgi:hypothetical protein